MTSNAAPAQPDAVNDPDATLPDITAVQPSERGHTTIADRVVEKIAARAATDVERAAGSTRKVFGISVGQPRPTDPAQVDVVVDGDIASIHLALSVRWPSPIRQVCRDVRDRVTEQVTTLTGLRVAEVDIDVTALPSRTTPEPQRVV